MGENGEARGLEPGRRREAGGGAGRGAGAPPSRRAGPGRGPRGSRGLDQVEGDARAGAGLGASVSGGQGSPPGGEMGGRGSSESGMGHAPTPPCRPGPVGRPGGSGLAFQRSPPLSAWRRAPGHFPEGRAWGPGGGLGQRPVQNYRGGASSVSG